MKRSIIAVLILLPICAMGDIIPSGVTPRGGKGLLRLPTARTLPKGHLCLHVHGGYRFESHEALHYTVSDTTSVTDRRHWGTSRFGFTYGAHDFVELHFGGSASGKYYEAVDEPVDREDNYIAAFRDINFGFKVGYPFYRPEAGGVGLVGALQFFGQSQTLSSRPDKDTLLTDSLGFDPFLKKKAEFGIQALADVEMEAISFHAGGGFLKAGDLYEESQEVLDSFNVHYPERHLSAPKNRILWGLGGAVAMGDYVEVFAEVSGRKILDKPESVPDTAYLSPGIRFKSPLGALFEISGDYGLIEGIPDWRLTVTLSATTSLLPTAPPPPKPPAIAIVTGSITDGETGEALIAELTFPEETDIISTSSTEKGIYEKELPPGTHVIEVQKEGYRWMKKVVILEPGEKKVVDFPLSKKAMVKKGSLTGRIYDARTEEAMIAQVKFPDTEIPPTASDRTGIYKADITPGTYTVHVEAEGYTVIAEPVVIGAGETIVKNFALRAIPKKGERIVLVGIHFESGKSTIQPDSYSILDQAAQVLKDNPNLVVEIGGHTDSVGSSSYNMKLSFARANAVREHLVTIHSIDPKRLIAKGYGEDRPISDNRTKEGRAKNRRIEYLILSD